MKCIKWSKTGSPLIDKTVKSVNISVLEVLEHINLNYATNKHSYGWVSLIFTLKAYWEIYRYGFTRTLLSRSDLNFLCFVFI